MAKRVRKVTKKSAKDRNRNFEALQSDEQKYISPNVWGQLSPLDKKAREMTAKWGDQLTSLVSPDLAGRFEAAYNALNVAVETNDVVRTHNIAAQLLKAWDVLEAEAIANGGKPLENAWAVELENGLIYCFALSGAAELRARYPDWIVYDIIDAARIMRADFSATFLEKALDTFPSAKVTSVIRDGKEDVNWDLGGDEIPW